MDIIDRRKISLSRASELKNRIEDFESQKCLVKKGMELCEQININKKRIKKILGATEKDWNNWIWQMNNKISDVDTLCSLVSLDEEWKYQIASVGEVYRWSVSPYYCSLMDESDPGCPVKRMVIPQIDELNDSSGCLDPMSEEFTNPAGSITRRYPDRLIINVTSECGAYCRFCQRRRNITETCGMISKDKIIESIQYIKDNKEIRDVLVTGGDPLTLSDDIIDWILKEIRSIPHVEIIRIGTRLPVTLPQRITGNLCRILKKYKPIYINTHINHPAEITRESSKAIQRLVDSGIVMGNQMVLLKGVNNDKNIVKVLNQELLKIRVRPYYIFNMKPVTGTSHFKCSIDEGIDIMEHLRGYTSGLAIPYYIVNAPGGLGKIPILPEYIISRSKEKIVLRTWEGKIITLEN